VVSLTPRNTGGTADSWSISPALPAGLTLNTANGAITGTPPDAGAPASFTLFATNQGGTGSVKITLGVQTVLLELGGSGASSIALSPTNMLTEAGGLGTQHWVLWDYTPGAIITQGDACPPGICSLNDVPAADHVELAGLLALVPDTGLAFDVLSVTSGSVLGKVVDCKSVC
jgi:Putative Ig domain